MSERREDAFYLVIDLGFPYDVWVDGMTCATTSRIEIPFSTRESADVALEWVRLKMSVRESHPVLQGEVVSESAALPVTAISDPRYGSCHRGREGCLELGLYKPFYRSFVCTACLEADSADVLAGHLPWGEPAGDEGDEIEVPAAQPAPGRQPVVLLPDRGPDEGGTEAAGDG